MLNVSCVASLLLFILCIHLGTAENCCWSFEGKIMFHSCLILDFSCSTVWVSFVLFFKILYVQKLTSFLGMTGYYMKFIHQYSGTSALLLLQRDKPWVWSPECAVAVQILKAHLTPPPVSAHFDISNHTLVTCNASSMATGTVLS